jgi:hypothetical protein
MKDMKDITQIRRDLNKMITWFAENPNHPKREENKQIVKKQLLILHEAILEQEASSILSVIDIQSEINQIQSDSIQTQSDSIQTQSEINQIQSDSI